MAYKDGLAERKQKWREENMTRKNIVLNKKTDYDIIEYVAKISNFQGYIKRLIRADIEKGH